MCSNKWAFGLLPDLPILYVPLILFVMHYLKPYRKHKPCGNSSCCLQTRIELIVVKIKFHKVGSMSTVSVTEDTGHHDFKPPVRFENTYQMGQPRNSHQPKSRMLYEMSLKGTLRGEIRAGIV
uniref:Uncharacterized protein n=1 Tax=Magallana gigas TaxID=29159 RepID=A0A8W8KYP6_MAGGI